MMMLGLRRFLSFPAHTKVLLPALSPTMEEGSIASWKKTEGDQVSAGDVICDIETDKATVDFEYQDEGYVAKRLVPAGTSKLKVGSLIAILVEDQASVAAFSQATLESFPESSEAKQSTSPPPPPSTLPPQGQPPAPHKTTTPPPSTPASSAPITPPTAERRRVFASPLARRIARESGKDLTRIPATGPNGRIVAQDVQNFVGGSAMDMSWPMNMLHAPHYYLNTDVDLSQAMDLLDNDLNASRKEDEKIIIDAFILRAAGLAMRKIPHANAAWGDNGSMRFYDYCDANFVLLADNQTRAPLIRGLHVEGLESLSQGIQDAKLGESNTDESPGTFSYTNVGALGIKSLVPIVRPGNSVALAIGETREQIVPDGSSFKVTRVATATLSCDHRVVDGAVGAQWLHLFKSLLEKPTSMLL